MTGSASILLALPVMRSRSSRSIARHLRVILNVIIITANKPQKIAGKWVLVFSFILCVVNLTFAQTKSSSLQQLRDQLISTEGLREADVVAIVSEHAFNDTAERMKGLEIKLANGVVMKINSVAIELKPAAAFVKLIVQAEASSKIKPVNFRLSGKLGNGEISGAHLRLPFQLTDVSLGAEDSKSAAVLKYLLSEWLAPTKWNSVLPPLEIPLQLKQTIEIPAATFESNGEMPMTLTTPAYQLPVEFWLQSFFVLDGRSVLALNLEPQPITQTIPINGVEDDAATVREIAQLAQLLKTNNDLSILIRKNAANNLLAKIAASREVDLTAKLKPGRIRSEEIDALVGKILNYTDAESGDGSANVSNLKVENFDSAKINLRLTGQGELNAKVKGREFGIPYNLSPIGKFSIAQELIPLTIISKDGRLIISAVTGSIVPVKVNLTIPLIGRPFNFSRTVNLQADQWLKGMELPSVFSQEIKLPRQIVMSKNNEASIANSALSRYTVTNLQVEVKTENIEIHADIK